MQRTTGFGVARRLGTLFCAAALAAAVIAGAAAAPDVRAQDEEDSGGPFDIGVPAPAMDVLEWLKDGPVELASLKGKNVVLLDIYSVNFTNTKEHVEKLNALQTKHAAAGLKVIGLFTDPPEDVKKFLAENPTKYSTGVDNLRNTVGTFGVGEPPLAVIIDKEGRIVWRGQVADDGDMVERVLSGRFDLAKTKKTMHLEREAGRLFQTKDPDQVGPAADALLAHEPSSLMGVNLKKWCFASKRDPKGWREFIAKHVPKVTESAPLNQLAWQLCTDDNLAWREPAAALAAAKKAVELCQGKDAAVVDTLARAWFEVGAVDRAIEVQKQAIAVVEADAGEAYKQGMQDVLAYYEAALAAGKAAKGDTAKPPVPPKKK